MCILRAMTLAAIAAVPVAGCGSGGEDTGPAPATAPPAARPASPPEPQRVEQLPTDAWSLEACLRRAGASIAGRTPPGGTSDLGFADPFGGGGETDLAADVGKLSAYSVKPSTLDPADGAEYNGDWRVYYALPRGSDIGYSAVLEDPGLAAVAAYLGPARPGELDVEVAAADRCLGG